MVVIATFISAGVSKSPLLDLALEPGEKVSESGAQKTAGPRIGQRWRSLLIAL